jgi:hypothetical protein
MEILVDTGVLLRAFNKSSSEQRLILRAFFQSTLLHSVATIARRSQHRRRISS